MEETIRRHFEPLLDPSFGDVLRRIYPNGVVLDVDGREVTASSSAGSERVPIVIRLGRRRTPSVVGFIERRAFVAQDHDGVAISTFGKVIKRGWEWLGLAPTGHPPVTGLIEAPDLAACLTLSKNDFIRSGARGAAYLAYRKAIQEVLSRQLAAWGDRRDEERPRMARLERDLERVLEDLVEDFPLLRSLVDRRPGGQKRLPMPGRGDERVPASLFATAAAHDESGGDAEPATNGVVETPAGPSASPPEPLSPESRPAQGQHGEEKAPLAPAGDQLQPHAAAAGALETVAGRRRPARYGLLMQFESRAGDPELGRLVDNTIWINDVHPAYLRAVASRSLGYHTALAVALALAPLAVERHDEHAFVTQFLAQWGAAQTTKSPRRRSGRGRRPVSRRR